ncbi:hypothetical protein AB0G32_27630 [Streptomyces sp. NPDC023723]|uniref:hypothetical protein n=1 Tax=Streptomyces sp. NPDC023723 TaxID=3154323 RepID=UPI0033F136B8
MTDRAQHSDRPKRRRRDSLWAIGLFALVAGVVVRLVFTGLSGWPSAVLGAVAMAFWTPWLIQRVRRREATAAGTGPDDIPGMERQILKGAPPPADPVRRREMAALVDSRRRRLRRNRWWAFPLLALMFFGTSVLWFTAGSVTAGSLMLVFAVLFMTWLTWFHLRFDRRLTQMRRRLQS